MAKKLKYEDKEHKHDIISAKDEENVLLWLAENSPKGCRWRRK